MSGIIPAQPVGNEPIRVAHVITDLMTGGAETMLYRLLGASDRIGFQSSVISLKQLHPVGDRIAALDIPVRALGMTRWPSPTKFIDLVKWLREFRPHVVQTWLPHADLLGGMATRFARQGKVAWGIHFGKLDVRTHGRLAKWTAQLNAILSRQLPSKIVCCSETSRRELETIGYDKRKLLVIPNGFDLREFSPDPHAREAILQEFQLPKNAQLRV